MSITHHLSDETLSDYAAGNLNEALEVVVACHLTFCPRCRQRAATADIVGGHFLASAEPSQTRATARDILNRSREEIQTLEVKSATQLHDTPTPDKTGSIYPAAMDVPMPLARRLPGSLDELNWRGLAPGIKQFNLQNTPLKEGAFKLLKLEPGVELVEHSHGGQELTLVMRGSYTDSIGRFGVGDIADLDDDTTHCPVVDSDEPCIALIATTSPAKYKSLVGKILQPFVGI